MWVVINKVESGEVRDISCDLTDSIQIDLELIERLVTRGYADICAKSLFLKSSSYLCVVLSKTSRWTARRLLLSSLSDPYLEELSADFWGRPEDMPLAFGDRCKDLFSDEYLWRVFGYVLPSQRVKIAVRFTLQLFIQSGISQDESLQFLVKHACFFIHKFDESIGLSIFIASCLSLASVQKENNYFVIFIFKAIDFMLGFQSSLFLRNLGKALLEVLNEWNSTNSSTEKENSSLDEPSLKLIKLICQFSGISFKPFEFCSSKMVEEDFACTDITPTQTPACSNLLDAVTMLVSCGSFHGNLKQEGLEYLICGSSCKSETFEDARNRISHALGKLPSLLASSSNEEISMFSVSLICNLFEIEVPETEESQFETFQLKRRLCSLVIAREIGKCGKSYGLEFVLKTLRNKEESKIRKFDLLDITRGSAELLSNEYQEKSDDSLFERPKSTRFKTLAELKESGIKTVRFKSRNQCCTKSIKNLLASHCELFIHPLEQILCLESESEGNEETVYFRKFLAKVILEIVVWGRMEHQFSFLVDKLTLFLGTNGDEM